MRTNQGVFIGSFSCDAEGNFSVYQNMPHILAPVPAAGSVSQLQALYIPKGKALWAAVKENEAADNCNRSSLLEFKAAGTMPRKQKGFGNQQSFAFKGAGRVDKGKGVGSPGIYPSVRRYGTSVTRTIIEKYDLDSNWTKWRQGYEMWNQAYYSILRVANPDYNSALPEDNFNQQYVPASLRSVLYQGTEFEQVVFFNAWEFPTLNADVNTHYVVKRSPVEVLPTATTTSVGEIQSLDNDEFQFTSNKQNAEIWAQGKSTERSRLLLEMIGDRLTDGTYSATLKNILIAPNRYCSQGEPALYKGKTAPPAIVKNSPLDLKQTTVRVTFPITSIIWPSDTEGRIPISRTVVTNQGISERLIDRTIITPDTLEERINELIGKIVYFPTSKLLSNTTAGKNNFGDTIEYFTVDLEDMLEIVVRLSCIRPRNN